MAQSRLNMSKAKHLLESFADRNNIQFNKIVIYQNLKFFFYPSLRYEYINPNHKVLLTGKHKGTHKNRSSSNNEKIAMFIRQYYPVYILALYIVLGITLFRLL